MSGGSKPEDIVATLRSVPTAPVQKVIAGPYNPSTIVSLTLPLLTRHDCHDPRPINRQDVLDFTQAHLRAATHKLSEQRKQIQAWQSRCAELDMLNQRLKNIQKAIKDKDLFDWMGRLEQDGDGDESATHWHSVTGGPSSTIIGMSTTASPFSYEPEPLIPGGNDNPTVVHEDVPYTNGRVDG